MMNTILLLAGLAAQALAAPVPKQQIEARAEVRPRVKNTSYVANVTDPSLSRDSCGSSRVGGRALWTCRDTTLYDTSKNECSLPVVTNTASWTNLDMTKGGPYLEIGPVGAGSSGTNNILKMYGNDAYNLNTYFPVLQDECPGYGQCQDSSRWAIWPDQPPVITSSGMDGSAIGYTWVPKAHLQHLNNLNSNPAHTLYKTTYTPGADNNALPTVSVVAPDFWKQDEIGFGQYGSVIRDDTLYLYGQTATKGTVLAKVPPSSVEDRSAYKYYVNGAWTSNMPNVNDASVVIPNAGAGGQGTFYYSTAYQSYIWIGQQSLSNRADFYMTTAPSPEGPWIQPYLIFQGKNGDNMMAPGYSLQAHPALLPSHDASEKGIYLTWTQQFAKETYAPVYNTPLVWVEFE